MSRPRYGAKPQPKAMRAVLADAGERMKVRMLIANGATETPIGAICILRMPGSQVEQRFPYDLVQEVKRDRGKWAEERRLEQAPSPNACARGQSHDE